MLKSSERLQAGDQNVFTNPTYSDDIPEGGRPGIFDNPESEMPPGETVAEEKEPSIPERIKTNLLDEAMILSAPKQLAYFTAMAASAFGLFWLVSILYMKISEMRLGWKVHDPSYWPAQTFPFLAEKAPWLFILLAVFAVLVGLELGQRYLKKARRMEGDTEMLSEDSFTSSGWLNYDTEELVNTFEIVYPTYDDDLPWLQRATSRFYGMNKEVLDNAVFRPRGLPLCMYEGKLFCMPDDPKYFQFRNKNVAICGISGGGKSFGAIKPMVMTILGKGESAIVTDTKGDLYQEIHSLCEKLEYNELVFDVKNPAYSDSWNCFKDIVEAEEGTVWDLVNIFADTIIQNTGYGHGSNNKSDYWTQNEQNLLRALIFYVCRSKYYTGKRTMEGLMEMLSLPALEIDARFKSLPESDPAFKTSSFYRNQADAKLKDNYRSGLRSKLEIFETPAICGMLSYDGIDFEEIVHKKSIVFLITPDHTGTYDVITSLFVTSMYNKLIEISDSKEYGGKLIKPFWFMLDELCNMAAINELSRKISTNRSRNVNMIFAIQSIPQMDSQYYNLARNILANCGTQMLFGTNDEETAKYYASRCGKVSIIERTDSEDRPPLSLHLVNMFSRKSRKSRSLVDLWPAYKVEQMGEEMLLAIATKKVMKAKPFPATLHPLFADTERVKMERSPEWYKQYLADDPSRKMPESREYIPSEYEKSKSEPVYSVKEYYKRQGLPEDGIRIAEEKESGASMKSLFEDAPEELSVPPRVTAYTKQEDARESVPSGPPPRETKPKFVYEEVEEDAPAEERSVAPAMDDIYSQIEGTL